MDSLTLDAVVGSFRPLGKHMVRLDGDILWLCFDGLVELSEMVMLAALSRQMYERFGYALVLCDGRLAKGVSAEARQYQNKQLKVQVYPSHSAVYGGNLLVRSIVLLTQRATELVTGKQLPVSFEKTEAEARARLELQRPRLCPKPGTAPSPTG